MKASTLKKHLIKIAESLTPDSTIEDVYEHLSLLADIDESEQQVKNGDVLSQNQVEEAAAKWLK